MAPPPGAVPVRSPMPRLGLWPVSVRVLAASVLLVLLMLPPQALIVATTDQSDVSALSDLYTSLGSPPQLTGWTATKADDPCAQSWKGVTCSGTAVTEIHLSGMQLNGTLGYSLNTMKSLSILDLSNNNIGGSGQIPYALPPNLQSLDLSANAFRGSGDGLPYSISLMSTLKYLNVSHNQLQGVLGDMFRNMSALATMDLSFNNFSGNLPNTFSNLSSLATLYLQDNQFTGPLDALVALPLENLNIAANHFSRVIPEKLKGIKNFQSDDSASPSPASTSSPSGRRANPGHQGSESPSSKGGGSSTSGKTIGVIAAVVVSVLVVGCILAFFLIKRRSKASSHEEKFRNNRPHTAPASSMETSDIKPIQTSISMDNDQKSVKLPSPVSLKPPPADRLKSFDEDDSFTNPIMKKPGPITATSFSVADLQMATDSFSMENLVGEGSIGRVYKAQFDDGKVLAVKKINSSALPNQASEDFLELVSKLSLLHHPNVTELIGYCCEHGQHLLVYEYMRNGSLQDLLHLSDEYTKPLTWNSRIKIALGTARALEYLHEVCSPSVVHKNFKSANILLDGELNPHLSDCGMSSLILSGEYQTLDQNLGFGYSAPEVVMSGQYTLKSDVYSFGVVMLELLTGRKPFDSSRQRSEQSLVRWATPQLHDIDALDKMVDPALKGLYPAKSLSRFADVIALCVQPEPEFRPPMSEVVQALVRLVQRANMSRRMGSVDEVEVPRRADDSERQDTF